MEILHLLSLLITATKRKETCGLICTKTILLEVFIHELTAGMSHLAVWMLINSRFGSGACCERVWAFAMEFLAMALPC